MRNDFRKAPNAAGLTDEAIRQQLEDALASCGVLNKVLLVPPDLTRPNAYAGPITCMLYEMLAGAEIDVLPALGTHMPMTDAELEEMFPGIPLDRFIAHNWRTDVVKIGEVLRRSSMKFRKVVLTAPLTSKSTNGLWIQTYDLVISIGQVVPHEVVGMANYNKNLFVGCGGNAMINASHYIGALYGMERMMGRDHSPVHKLFDYAEKHFLMDRPVMYCLTVTTTDSDDVVHVHSLATGRSRDLFAESIRVSQELNLGSSMSR